MLIESKTDRSSKEGSQGNGHGSSNSENVERVFTPHGAGRGNILGIQDVRDEAEDEGCKNSKSRLRTSVEL